MAAVRQAYGAKRGRKNNKKLHLGAALLARGHEGHGREEGVPFGDGPVRVHRQAACGRKGLHKSRGCTKSRGAHHTPSPPAPSFWAREREGLHVHTQRHPPTIPTGSLLYRSSKKECYEDYCCQALGAALPLSV